MIETSKTLDRSNKQKNLQDLIDICKQLHMNEIEIALWSLHIDFSKWDLGIFQLKHCLLFTALKAKEQLSSNDLFFEALKNDALKEISLSNYFDLWNREYPIWANFTAEQINLQYENLRHVFLFNIKII